MDDMLDQDAENKNRHAFVGVHWELGKLLAMETDEATATKVMRAIVDRGGLHEMEG